jgi:integrase/recombinase XerD
MGNHSDAMREAMALRGFAARTQKAYLGWMRRLVKQSKRTADELSESEVRSFLLRLTDEKRSVSTINQAISAFAFFYGDVVPREWRLVGYQRAPQRLPVTLSAEEVRRLLDAAPTLRQRAIMKVSSGAGAVTSRPMSCLDARHAAASSSCAGIMCASHPAFWDQRPSVLC